jgi:hypothetical protein
MENAKTPATPTTAMSSAVPPSAENTNAFSRFDVSTSARTSSSVLGRSTAWSAAISRTGARHGRDERVRICCNTDKFAAGQASLAKRLPSSSAAIVDRSPVEAHNPALQTRVVFSVAMEHAMRPRTTAVRRLLGIVAIPLLSGLMIDSGQNAGRRSAIPQPTPSPPHASHLPESLGQAVMSARYAFYRHGDGTAIWYADNPAQRLRAEFTARGMQVTTRAADGAILRVAMSVRSIGYGARQQPVTTGHPNTTASRFELSRSASGHSRVAVSEWYVNSPGGLEQCFSIERPPDERVEGEPLRLVLSLDGELSAQVTDDGQAIVFRDASAVPVLRYDKLAVADARGRTLPARMEAGGNALWLDVEDRDAVWPITIDPTFSLLQKLLAPDAAAGDQFGGSVAISGDTVVVGAPANPLEPAPSGAGSAYVFVRTGGLWAHQQTLVPADSAVGDEFGISVAIDGDTLVVGAFRDDGPAGTNQGSAYVFERIGGVWVEQAPKLVAPNADANDLFGNSVAIEGDTIVVGALDAGALGQGMAYVFARSGGTWILQQELAASDATFGDLRFGVSVAISGETVAIGASGDDIGQIAAQGSVYVFTRSGTVWNEHAKLVASDGAEADNFGHSVGLSGDTLVVGAPLVDLIGVVGIDVGAAYVFVRAGDIWTQQQKLFTSDPDIHDEVAFLVAISGGTIVLSADLDNTDPLFDHGSAYVFSLTNGVWTQTQKLLAPDRVTKDQFGYSVAISGQTIVVGAPFDDEVAVDQGSVYIFVNTPPQITAAPVSRPQGTSQSGVVIGAVSDAQSAASDLIVAVNGSTGATSNGVTVSGLVVGSSGQVTASVGVTCSASTASFTLRVTDTGGLFAEDTLTVTVTPSSPPAIVLNPPISLWPPDHTYYLVPVSAMVASAADDCDGDVTGNVVIEKVTSDEPDDAPGGADGLTSNDILIAANCRAAQVRSERDATKNGRVYSITLRVGDSSGNVANVVFRIGVPHDLREAAVEDGPSVTVIGCGGGG